MYFSPPRGVEFVRVDPHTGMRAGPYCFEAIEEVFIDGTAPTEYCSIHAMPPALSYRTRDR
jgi:membrane carboxypeptidase/penicillin-binding protein